jgi:hypothetical protein
MTPSSMTGLCHQKEMYRIFRAIPGHRVARREGRKTPPIGINLSMVELKKSRNHLFT